MKMASARLKILTLKVIIIVFVMIRVKPDETWMHGDWFYTTDYGIFGHERPQKGLHQTILHDG